MENKENNNVLTFEDENGKQITYELLFSIVYPKTNTRYIYVLDPEDESKSTVLVFSCDDDGNVVSADLDNDKELEEFINKTFEAYQNGELYPVGEYDSEIQDEEKEEEGENKKFGCSCDCSCDCDHCSHSEK